MNIILLGPQGSGKGTQARLLTEKLGLFYIESGDLLRAAAKDDPRIDEIINKQGQLLPDTETFSIVTDYINNNKPEANDLLFDGYPRTIKQYELLQKWLGEKGSKIDCGFYLNISDEEAIKRLSARRMDPSSGKIYNLITDPPEPEVNKDSLIQRPDDRPDAIKKRLGWFKTTVAPMIELIRKDIPFYEVDGERPIQVIFADILQKLGK